MLTGADADVGVVAYQMNMLVKKIGYDLSAAPRAAAGPGAAEVSQATARLGGPPVHPDRRPDPAPAAPTSP
ncbi:hypothetical protein SFUMM280S_00441 [Streptomyces fumanus]